jgi:hypothetical protein
MGQPKRERNPTRTTVTKMTTTQMMMTRRARTRRWEIWMIQRILPRKRRAMMMTRMTAMTMIVMRMGMQTPQMTFL